LTFTYLPDLIVSQNCIFEPKYDLNIPIKEARFAEKK
jgi:hypothetical protein